MSPAPALGRFAQANFESLDIEGADKSAARDLRGALEREIARVARSGGANGLASLIAELNSLGHQFRPAKTDPGWISYSETTNGGTRSFHIHVQLDADSSTVMVLYNETIEATVARRRARMSASERKQADIEDEYARRGLALNTGRRKNASLGPADRLIACLHELEGGVSNGGFRTYLSNSCGARMADAQRYLEKIGARRTAKVIADVRSLFPRGFGAAFRRDPEAQLDARRDALDRLTSKFYDLKENVPILVMRYMNATNPRKPKPSAHRRKRA